MERQKLSWQYGSLQFWIASAPGQVNGCAMELNNVVGKENNELIFRKKVNGTRLLSYNRG